MGGESILVIDDDPSILAFCKRVLSHEGYDLKLADGGYAALHLAQAQAFDLALIDINMPGLNGLDTYRQLLELQPELMGVIITGFGTLQTAIEALELGFSAFMTKPFSLEQLTNTVSQALVKRRLQRENERLRALLPLFDISRQMISTTELEELLPLVVRVARGETGADGATLWLRGKQQMRVMQPAGYRQDPPDFLPLSTRAQQQIMAGIEDRMKGVEFALLKGEALPSEWRFAEPLIACGVHSLLCVSLRVQETHLGTLCLMRMDSGVSFSEADRGFITVLAGQAGVAIQNARLLSEIQRAYDELKQLDHMKSEFISIASHELRTPLSHIMGYSALLEPLLSASQGSEVQDRATSYLEVIQSSAERLADLLNDMLNLRYLEASTSALQLREVCLQELVESLLEGIRPLARAKGQRLVTVLDPEPILLAMDEEKLGLAVEKVLSNAVKFTPEGGSVRVSLCAEDGWAMIGVQDTGVGIRHEALAHIFEPFYQAEESLIRQHEGIGLGLPIAKGMVELHGGRIEVDSEVGQGTLVTIRLPLKGASGLAPHPTSL